MNIAQNQADLQRHQAKYLLRRMFGIQDGDSNGTVEALVDCIIGAAILEMAAIQSEAMQKLPTTGSLTSSNAGRKLGD